MKHFWSILVVSVALHVGAGWLLRELRPAPEALAWQPPMAIQLVSLAPLSPPAPPAPPTVAKAQPISRPVQPPAAAKVAAAPKATPAPVKAAASTSPSAAVAKAAPPASIQRPAPRPARAPSPPTPSVSQPALANTASPPTPTVAAPTPAAAPALTPVVSLRPSYVTPPPPPRYPNTARRRNQQGVVRVEVRLDERGQQQRLTLIRSSGFESLDLAALEAVTNWRFRPEIVDGRAVPSRVEIPIEFALTANR